MVGRIDGQISIFDFRRTNEKLKPCEYRFVRYVGQKVWLNGEIKTIAEIEPYYTITADGLVGTPSTIYQVKEEEYGRPDVNI